MKIITAYPPNWNDIKTIDPPKDAVFPYGEIIYNPSGEEIPPDIQFHEQIHIKQQKAFPSPDIWWTKWLLDKDFRKEQEEIAFTQQCLFVKKFMGSNAYKDCLRECSEKLSNNYKLDITIHQAETLIRLRIKNYVN